MPSFVRAAAAELRPLTRTLLRVVCWLYLPLVGLSTVLHFPWDVDPPANGPSASAAGTSSTNRSARFYEVTYRAAREEKRGLDYEATAKAAARVFRIEDAVRKFVADHNLQQKKVLEIGSGRGYLQDMVEDYTGLDISPTVAPNYHKRFVVGSATELPFADSSFDAAWSVWVLEHIPQPERALREMRRVIRPGGVLFLYVAWQCQPWLADGFEVRPYSDFNWRGKLVKSTIGLRGTPAFLVSWLYPVRAIRWAHYSLFGDSTRLRFRSLDPNYEIYWQPDSDAAVSLDSFETYLWFRSRGDECVNCGSSRDEFNVDRLPLIIRIWKPARTLAASTR